MDADGNVVLKGVVPDLESDRGWEYPHGGRGGDDLPPFPDGMGPDGMDPDGMDIPWDQLPDFADRDGDGLPDFDFPFDVPFDMPDGMWGMGR